MCERCGFIWNQHRLSDQHDWRGPRLQNLNIFVCPDCIDEPQQNGQRAFRLPPDPVPVVNPSPDPNMIEGAGPQYGPELVLNGGFYSSDGWLLQNGALISDGALRFTGQALSRATRAAADTLVNGSTYLASFDVLNNASSTATIRVDVGGTTSDVTINQDMETYTTTIVSTAASQFIRFICVSATFVYVDNFSVKERL